MAWASIGSRGTATAKTSGADLSFNPTATVGVGRVLVVCIAWPISYTRTPEGASWGAVAVHDTKGNLYTQLGGFTWESYVSIHICRVTSAITTGDTITVHHRDSFHEPKALTAWEFSMDTTKVWARYHDPVGGGASPTATTASGIGGTGAQYEFQSEVLIIEAISSMGPETDGYTPDPNYTPMTKAGTTGGGPESNITVFASFRIATIPNDVVNTTRDVARFTDTVVTALYETTYVSDFPRFPILDDFNRANESPLDNGTWEQPGYPVTCTPGYADGYLALDGNRVRRASWGAAGAWWLEPLIGCYSEVYVSMPVRGQAGVHLDGGGCGANATMGGYAGFWWPQSAGYYPDDQFMNGYSGNTGLVAGNPLRTWVDMEDNYRFGLQRDSRTGYNFIHGWIYRGSGWEWVNCWNEVVFGPYQGRMGPSVWGDDLTRLDDFGAGASPCPEFWVGLNWREADRRAEGIRRALVNQSDT